MSEQLTIVVKGDAAQFTRTMTTVDRAIQKAQGSVRSFGSHTASNTQAASAAIRLLEGDMTNMVRAAENFVGRSRVLSGVLRTAFPVIGAAAVVAVLTEGAQRAAEFVRKMQQVPQALQNAFRQATTSGQLTNDELQKTNDQLANQIAKLEGHHQNNLAIAIDDARIAADKLAQSLDQDNQKIASILKTNSIGWIGSLFTGKDTTTEMAGDVRYWNQELANKGYDFQQAVHSYGPDSQQAKAAKAALDQRRATAEANMRMEIDYRGPGHAANVTGDQTANLNIARGYLSILQEQDDQEALQAQNKSLTAKQQQLQHAKDFAEEQRKANEGVQKNVRDILTQRKENDQQMADYARTPGLIAPHPLLGMNGQPGSTPQGLALNNDLSQNSEMTKGLGDASKAAAGWLHNLNEGVAIQKANADALAEQSLQMAIATGRISRLDAAQVQAQLHTQEYTEALKTLQGNRAAIMARTDLSPLDRKQQLSGIDNQITTLRGQRAGQSAQDQAAIQAAQPLNQLRDAAAQLALRFTDLGTQLSDLMVQTVQGVNQSLATALMSHSYSGQEYRRNITNALSGQARQLGARGLNVAFQQLEGGLFGKRADGSSAASALWVRMAGIGGAAASGASSIGAGLSGLWGRIVSHLPHFAGGGPTPSNMPIVVGENGPEIFNPGVAGSITPNSRISSLGGTHISIPVDARGASDPAAMHATAQRAVLEAVPHILQAVHASTADQRRRTVGPR